MQEFARLWLDLKLLNDIVPSERYGINFCCKFFTKIALKCLWMILDFGKLKNIISCCCIFRKSIASHIMFCNFVRHFYYRLGKAATAMRAQMSEIFGHGASPDATMGIVSVKLNYVYFAAYMRTRLSKSNVFNRQLTTDYKTEHWTMSIRCKSQTWVRLLDGVTDIAIVDRKSTLRAATLFDLYLCQTWSHARLPKQTYKHKNKNYWRVINGSIISIIKV